GQFREGVECSFDTTDRQGVLTVVGLQHALTVARHGRPQLVQRDRCLKHVRQADDAFEVREAAVEDGFTVFATVIATSLNVEQTAYVEHGTKHGSLLKRSQGHRYNSLV